MPSREALAAQIASATQRIEVVGRAEKMQGLLEEFAPFMDAKSSEWGKEQKTEMAGRMAAGTRNFGKRGAPRRARQVLPAPQRFLNRRR